MSKSYQRLPTHSKRLESMHWLSTMIGPTIRILPASTLMLIPTIRKLTERATTIALALALALLALALLALALPLALPLRMSLLGCTRLIPLRRRAGTTAAVGVPPRLPGIVEVGDGGRPIVATNLLLLLRD